MGTPPTGTGADPLTLLVKVQRRTERANMARTARVVYGATCRTLVR